VGTEVETVSTFASRFGLQFLKGFIQGVPIGTLLRDLRTAGVPLGLLYFAYCPAETRVQCQVVPAAMAQSCGGLS
jgi:hypothetical protein